MKIMSARTDGDEITLLGIRECAGFKPPLLVHVSFRERGHGDYTVRIRPLTDPFWTEYAPGGGVRTAQGIPEVEAEVKALLAGRPVLGDDFLEVH
jgi:hypothetical protein